MLLIFSLIAGKEVVQKFFQNQKGVTSNVIDIIFYVLIFLVIIYFIYAAIPQIIINIQAKREILKEIEILIDKRIIQLKRDTS